MSTDTTSASDALPALPQTNYLTVARGLKSWLTTTDHKRIAIMYLIMIVTFFVVAMGLGVTMRLELLRPGTDFMGPAVYNRVLTLHGVILVFLFFIPSFPAVFGNFFLPILIGAEDVSFPRINLMSWYCFVVGALLALVSVILGGVDKQEDTQAFGPETSLSVQTLVNLRSSQTGDFVDLQSLSNEWLLD